MTRLHRLPLLALALLGLGLSTLAPAASATPSFVLRAEAAGPVQSWAKGLGNLKYSKIAIEQNKVVAHFGDDCRLLVSHAIAPECPIVRSIGNAVACWRGGGCPSLEEREEALKAAGKISLPWLDLSVGTVEAEERPADLERIRTQVTDAMADGDHEAARKALKPLLTRKKPIRAEEWPSLLPLAAALGEGQGALEVAQREELEVLGPAVLAVMSVSIVRGPALAAAAAAAVATEDNACALVSVAAAWQMVDPRAAASLASLARQLKPECMPAYAVEAHAWTQLGEDALAVEVREAAQERFEGLAKLAPMTDAYRLDSGEGEALQAELEGMLKSGDRSEALLLRLIAVYSYGDEAKDRGLELAMQAADVPEDKPAALMAGAVLVNVREYAKAWELLQGVEAQFPRLAKLQVWMAVSAFHLGKKEDALARIDKARKLAPKDPEVLRLVGEMYRDFDRAKARKAFEEAVAAVEAARLSGPEAKVIRGAQRALVACGDDLATPCAGEWSVEFDSVAKAKAMALQKLQDADVVKKRDAAQAKLEGSAPPPGGAEGKAPAPPEQPKTP